MLVKGRLYPHRYEPLISRELWDKCQRVRENNTVSHQVHGEKTFLYRGLLRCSRSGRMVAVDRKKDKHNYLVYYDKSGKKRFYMKEEAVTEQVTELLKKIRIPDHIYEEAKAFLKSSYEAEKEFYAESIKSLQKEDALVSKKLENLLDMRLEGEISRPDYEKKQFELKARQKEILEEIDRHQNGDAGFRDSVTLFLDCAHGFYDFFTKSSNDALKRQLLNFAIRTFEINAGKVHISLRPPFHLFLKNDAFRTWRPQGDCENPFLRSVFSSLRDRLRVRSGVARKPALPRRTLGVLVLP